MRRLKYDREDQQDIDDALSRAATPMHERVTEEFDSRELITRLGQTAEFGADFESHEWSADQEAWAMGIEAEGNDWES